MWCGEADERADAIIKAEMAAAPQLPQSDIDISSLTAEQRAAIVLASDVMLMCDTVCMKIMCYHGRWLRIILQ